VTTIQIRPCKDVGGGEVVQCFESEAGYFGVYVGTAGDFMWIADFDIYSDARSYAEYLSGDISDLVQLERDLKCET
jgi:hypothetical protein